ncbi:MAG: cytochrome P450 [Actinomycetota bacterium]|nr:cytochrome P450 [Actinomycetota bacterium]
MGARAPRPPRGARLSIPGASTLAFWRDPIGSLLALAEHDGDVVHWKFAGTDTYLLKDPEHIKRVLVNDHRDFMKGRALQVARRVLGNGLLTSEGEFHDRQRRLLRPLFLPERVASYGPRMVEAAKRTSARWREGETVDVQREMARLTLAVIGDTIFAADLAAEADELADALTVSLDALNLFMLPYLGALERLPLPSMRRFRRAQARLDRTVARLIDERRRAGEKGDDLPSLLLAAAGRNAWREREMRDEAITILLAGHETTATALAWTWHLLACHSEAEAMLHRELDRELAGRPPTVRDLPRLTYADLVVKEALRLYPPAWLIGRRALVDYRLDDYEIDAGSILIVSPYVTHHDPRFYPHPFRFDPARWTPEERKRRPRYSYFPFGAGPRVCIGETFAWTETLLVLATLAQGWRMRSLPGYEPRLEPRVTLRPRGGMPMTLARRSMV